MNNDELVAAVRVELDRLEALAHEHQPSVQAASVLSLLPSYRELLDVYEESAVAVDDYGQRPVGMPQGWVPPKAKEKA